MTNRADAAEWQDQYNGTADHGYDDEYDEYYEYDDDYELEPLEVPLAIAVHDLAELMETTPIEVIKEFMRTGYMFSINEVVQHALVAEIAPSFGFDVLPLEEEAGVGSIVPSTDDDDPSMLEERPAVVTILGHVDHGKTTLLDTIRKTNVVEGEAGGITQHIGAYQVNYDENLITFLDTPGHEAFTAMRARGAQVTDIAVLVIAADDGIMPQTEEAINHVKAAGVPIVVAINKVDRPEADPERVKRQLAERDLLIEEWGGDVIALPVSALTGDGVDDLLDNLSVVAEVSELKANVGKEARGVVVEARIDRSRGTVATVLVQTGVLRIGDNVVVGTLRGRIRAMFTRTAESRSKKRLPLSRSKSSASAACPKPATFSKSPRTSARLANSPKRASASQSGSERQAPPLKTSTPASPRARSRRSTSSSRPMCRAPSKRSRARSTA